MLLHEHMLIKLVIGVATFALANPLPMDNKQHFSDVGWSNVLDPSLGRVLPQHPGLYGDSGASGNRITPLYSPSSSSAHGAPSSSVIWPDWRHGFIELEPIFAPRDPSSWRHAGYINHNVVVSPSFTANTQSVPNDPLLSAVYDHLPPINELGSSSARIQPQILREERARSPTFDNLEPLDDHDLHSVKADTYTGQVRPEPLDAITANEQASDTEASRSPESLRRELEISNSAFKMLQQHPNFIEWDRDGKTKGYPLVVEMSPEAQRLKTLINTDLFNGKLEWGTRGDGMIISDTPETRLRRFVSRVQDRTSFVTTTNLMGFGPNQGPGRILAAPHRNYRAGNVMFEPDYDLAAKRLQFSFWTPSDDVRRPRLQFVGAASLKHNDAVAIVRQADLANEGAIHADNTPWPPVRPPPRPATRYSYSHDWLNNFAVVERIGDSSVQRRATLSSNLMSQLHFDFSRIRARSNHLLFGGNIVWQNKPEEVILGPRSVHSDDIVRYHKGSYLLYVTKPVVSKLLGYRLVLIPYRVQGERARLFDSSLTGNAHAFTLWAARGDLVDPEVFDFVGGGALNLAKTDAVLQGAQVTLQRLTDMMAHA